MGSLFENLVVIEALKARCNRGAESNLYFFRNSKGLEIDLLLREDRTLNLFEIKSGKALNDDFTRNMIKFRSLFPNFLSPNSAVHGTVIYSGEDYEAYKNYRYLNFHQTADYFKPKSEPFVLNY